MNSGKLPTIFSPNEILEGSGEVAGKFDVQESFQVFH
jgi:hypothetical protein